MSEITGGCLCGNIRYTIRGDLQMSAVCHCKNCQKQAGTAFSTIVGMTPDMITIEGEPKTYVDSGDSGNVVHRKFCPECGSPVFTEAGAAPGMIFVKAGSFDDESQFTPGMHFYTKSKHAWLPLDDSVPAFDTVPG